MTTIITTSDGLIAGQDNGQPLQVVQEKYFGSAGYKKRNQRARELRRTGWLVKVRKWANPFGGEAMYELTATKEAEK